MTVYCLRFFTDVFQWCILNVNKIDVVLRFSKLICHPSWLDVQLLQALNRAMPHSRSQLEGVNRKELIFYFFYLKCTQNILSKTQQTIINGLYQTYIASRIVLFKVTT